MKPLTTASATVIWTIGDSSTTNQIINYCNQTTHLLTFRKLTSIEQASQFLQFPTQCSHHLVFVDIAAVTYSDLDGLRALQDTHSGIQVVACFSDAHLGKVSYAWALDFSAYSTVDDSAQDMQQLINHLLEQSASSPIYSQVFCHWLRQYGILFINDHGPDWLKAIYK